MSSYIDKAKAKAQELAEQAKPLADKAKDQASELADKAKPLAGKAVDKAGDAVDKARPIAVEAVEKVSDGIDVITGRRYTEKIDSVKDKVEDAVRGKPKATPAEEPTDIVDAEIVPDEPAPGDTPEA